MVNKRKFYRAFVIYSGWFSLNIFNRFSSNSY